jgi:hypothetical protein
MSAYFRREYFYITQLLKFPNGFSFDVKSVLCILLLRTNPSLLAFTVVNVSYKDEVRDDIRVFACKIVLS